MKRFSLIASACLSVFLAACASNPGDGGAAAVEQAVSQQTALTDQRQRAKVHTELGMLYLMEGRMDIALEEARIAIEAEAGYAPAHNLTGLIHMALRKNELAEQSFRRALNLAGGDPEINNDYGWFLCQTGRPRESIAHFERAIGNPLFKTPIKAMTNAGLCSLLFKDDRQAESYFLRALRLDRVNAPAYFWLADIAYREGRFADARQRMKELHAVIEPTAESAWLGLRIDRKLGDREGEARYMGLMRRKYRDTPEFQKMTRGEFD
jgi:type IV pilus assembly protein PilF